MGDVLDCKKWSDGCAAFLPIYSVCAVLVAAGVVGFGYDNYG